MRGLAKELADARYAELRKQCDFDNRPQAGFAASIRDMIRAEVAAALEEMKHDI